MELVVLWCHELRFPLGSLLEMEDELYAFSAMKQQADRLGKSKDWWVLVQRLLGG